MKMFRLLKVNLKLNSFEVLHLNTKSICISTLKFLYLFFPLETKRD